LIYRKTYGIKPHSLAATTAIEDILAKDLLAFEVFRQYRFHRGMWRITWAQASILRLWIEFRLKLTGPWSRAPLIQSQQASSIDRLLTNV
jgi:hypothetical protein